MAWFFPFELFLLAYAILGPLHYLTEINWIEKRGFFLPTRSMAWFAFICALLIFLPKLLLIPFIANHTTIGDLILVKKWIEYNNIFILLSFVMAAIFLVTQSWKYAVIGVITSVLIGIIINNNYQYQALIGLLLPTLIHVYIFTLLFMLYGSLKAKSRPGLYAVLIMLLVPVIITVIPTNTESIAISSYFKDAFVQSEFYVTNAMILGWLGLHDGSEFSFTGTLDIKFQTFIAFAYTYHYLNWFTKTSVIKWHRSLDRKRSILVVVIWILSIGLFAIDYFVGTILLLFLSTLHVLLEFPINIKSISGIYGVLFRTETDHL